MFEKKKKTLTLNQTLNLTDKFNKISDKVDKSKHELPSKFGAIRMELVM